MHPFEYLPARNLTEAISALARHGDRARAFAGGTDLLVQLRDGRYELDAIVDIKRIPEVMELRLDGDGLHIGAALPCYRLDEDDACAKAYPGIIDGASIIGGTQIQSRASLGGNLCNATPSADGIGPLIVHSASAVITGTEGTYSVPVEGFCTGPGTNVLRQGEMLMAIDVPAPASHFGAAYQRFIPRNEMDIAVVGVAASLVLNAAGDRIESAMLALAAVGPTPIVATAAADSLVGKAPTEESFREAGALAADASSPIEDMRGTIEQRRELTRVLTRRTLAQAAERAARNR